MNGIHGVYGILPPDLPLEGLLAKAEAAMKGGVRILQLRDKQTPADLRVSRARRLRAVTHDYGCKLIINDDAELALAVGADGVHVGPSDCDDLPALRARLGKGMLLGVSCKGDVAAAKRALAAGADYVSFGAIFPTGSKAGVTVVGLDTLHLARQRLPNSCLVAIGGITADNIADVRRAGADAAAVIAALFAADDVALRAKRLIAAWEGH